MTTQGSSTRMCETIFIDGSETPLSGSGYGVFWSTKPNFSFYGSCAGTNNRAELYALCQVLKQINYLVSSCGFTYEKIEIYSDSKYVVEGFSKSSPYTTSHSLLWQEVFNYRKTQIELYHIRGHQGHLGNEVADRLANREFHPELCKLIHPSQIPRYDEPMESQLQAEPSTKTISDSICEHPNILPILNQIRSHFPHSEIKPIQYGVQVRDGNIKGVFTIYQTGKIVSSGDLSHQINQILNFSSREPAVRPQAEPPSTGSTNQVSILSNPNVSPILNQIQYQFPYCEIKTFGNRVEVRVNGIGGVFTVYQNGKVLSSGRLSELIKLDKSSDKTK